MATAAADPALAALLARSLTPGRLSIYVTECHGSLADALVLYQWNTEATGVFWETLGQWEVILRSVIDGQLRRPHVTRDRPGSWLDDPAGELAVQARSEIDVARGRVRRKGKVITDGQIVSELSFGFWSFLISRRYTNLWPDVATCVPHAPNRRLSTVETPVAHLHELRNRLAHQQRVWSKPLRERSTEMIDLPGASTQLWDAGCTTRAGCPRSRRPGHSRPDARREVPPNSSRGGGITRSARAVRRPSERPSVAHPPWWISHITHQRPMEVCGHVRPTHCG